jgi:hypothetical protein
MKGRVNAKELQTMMYYQYMNFHLQLLFNAKDKEEKAFQIKQLTKIRDILLKLGYFEGNVVK